MPDRYKVVPVFGESANIFNIVDAMAPEADQPAVLITYRHADVAHNEADKLNAEERIGQVRSAIFTDAERSERARRNAGSWRCHICGLGFEYEYQLENHRQAFALDHCGRELAMNFYRPAKEIIELWSARAGISFKKFQKMRGL